jgi:hypothetical protein
MFKRSNTAPTMGRGSWSKIICLSDRKMSGALRERFNKNSTILTLSLKPAMTCSRSNSMAHSRPRRLSRRRLGEMKRLWRGSVRRCQRWDLKGGGTCDVFKTCGGGGDADGEGGNDGELGACADIEDH